MASVRVRFSPGFLSGAGFPGEHVFRGFSGAPVVPVIKTALKQPHFTFADTLWIRISYRAFFSLILRCSSGKKNHARAASLNLSSSSGVLLEQIALWEILFLMGILG
jgi:hypothetical protein